MLKNKRLIIGVMSILAIVAGVYIYGLNRDDEIEMEPKQSAVSVFSEETSSAEEVEAEDEDTAVTDVESTPALRYKDQMEKVFYKYEERFGKFIKFDVIDGSTLRAYTLTNRYDVSIDEVEKIAYITDNETMKRYKYPLD